MSAVVAPPVAQYLIFLAASGRPPSTRRLRREQLAHFWRSVAADPEGVTEAQLVAWLGAQAWKPETLRSYRAALRGFYRWAAEAGLVGADPAVGLPRVPVVLGAPRPAPEAVWASARARADPRVALMLRLAAEAGLRRGEIARTAVGDVLDGAAGPSLRVCGKGGRTRVVPISAGLAAAIRATSREGWVFSSRRGGHLSEKWVGSLCAAALPDAFTLHSLRHRYATRVYAGSHDLRAVQILLGHSSPAITQRYVLVPDEDVRRAAMLAAQQP